MEVMSRSHALTLQGHMCEAPKVTRLRSRCDHNGIAHVWPRCSMFGLQMLRHNRVAVHLAYVVSARLLRPPCKAAMKVSPPWLFWPVASLERKRQGNRIRQANSESRHPASKVLRSTVTSQQQALKAKHGISHIREMYQLAGRVPCRNSSVQNVTPNVGDPAT